MIYKGWMILSIQSDEQLVMALSSWIAARSRMAGPNFKPKIRVKWDSVRTRRAEPSIECSWKTWKIRKDSLKLSFSRGHNWFFGAPAFFRLETFQLRIYVEIVWILAWSSHESLNVPRVVHDLLVGETSGSSGQQRTCIHINGNVASGKVRLTIPVHYSTPPQII